MINKERNKKFKLTQSRQERMVNTIGEETIGSVPTIDFYNSTVTQSESVEGIVKSNVKHAGGPSSNRPNDNGDE